MMADGCEDVASLREQLREVQATAAKETEAAAAYASVAIEVEAQLMAALKDARQKCDLADEFAEAVEARAKASLEEAAQAHADEMAQLRAAHTTELEKLASRHAEMALVGNMRLDHVKTATPPGLSTRCTSAKTSSGRAR